MSLINYFADLSPILQAFIATIFTWGVTAFGAAFVLLNIKPHKKLIHSMLGFAGGIMISASFWSLLQPSIELSQYQYKLQWFPPTAGFIFGVFFILILDKIIPHLHLDFPENKKEGLKSNLNKTFLFILAVTLHNIPEGLAIGIAFGAAGLVNSNATVTAAMSLALGIGIQNFPEGFAVSMPLKALGYSNGRSFFWGQASAIVEPIFAVLGVIAISFFHPILPYALSFAAGAMMYVVIEEVIPESQLDDNTDLATISTLFGFILMMILELVF